DFLALQFLQRFPNAQVFAFDRHSSSRTLYLALGGKFFPLGGPGQQLQLCPLENLDTDQQRAWACQYIEMLALANGLQPKPEHRTRISATVREMANARRRSLTELVSRLRNAELQSALEFYTCASTATNGLLDGESDGLALGSTRVCC